MYKKNSDRNPHLKSPDEWKTGDEPMTQAQKSFLETLSSQLGQNKKYKLTKAEAAKEINRLQKLAGKKTTNLF